MNEDCDLAEHFVSDTPSLLCEELEDLKTNNAQETTSSSRRREGDEEVSNQRGNEEAREETEREETNGGEEKEENKVVESEKERTVRGDEEEVKTRRSLKDGESQDVQIEDKETEKKETKTKKSEQKKSRKRRGKKQNEQVRNRRAGKDANKKEVEEKRGQTQEASVMTSEENPALLEPSVSLLSNCDLSDQVYLGFGGAEMYCPPVPTLLPYSSQPPVPIQPAPSQSHRTKRPRSPPQHHSLPPQTSQAEMEITQVCSTRRSVRYSSRGRSQTLSIPLLSGSETADSCPLPPAPKKKTRTLYTTDQLEHLEALFQEDHYPDAEKRKLIAASVGVTPQRIMVWFQNRRAKWRKVRSNTAKTDSAQSVGSPNHKFNPPLNMLTSNRKGAPSYSGHFTAHLPPLASQAPFPTQTPPSISSLLESFNSPGQCRGRDVGQHQLPSQGSLPEFHPRPLHSPPPLRRASLPLFTTMYNPVSPNPPLLNTPAHTPPLFLDVLESGSSLVLDSQSLQTDTSSLFDFAEKLSYQTSGQQSSSLSYQISYPTSQQQTALMSYLTPSPYLTPNPPDSNPTSYLTFGPGGNSTGVVTYSTGGQTFFPSQSARQILLQSAGHNGGMPAYPSYPWGNLYSQAAVHQQAPPTYPASLGSSRDHQPPSTSSLPLPSFFPQEDQGSHVNLQQSSHTQTHTETTSTTTTVLPPVSTLRPPHLRAETTPNKVSSLLSSQVSSPTESPPVPPCVKIEYDSPREIHSHFHCDFSPIHF